MIDRRHRFHGHNSLRTVYRQGAVVRSATLSLRYLKNQRRRNYRVAVVVSRKVSKLAVVRNRIRRRIYEVMRTEGVFIPEAYDLVITVFSEQIAEQDAVALQKNLKSLLKKAGVSKANRIGQAPPDRLRGIVDRKGNQS